MHYLDLATWKRKEHFEFFNAFDEPFYGITVDVDCTAVYNSSKENGQSFYLRYLHTILTAINTTETLRYRITEDDKVVVYDAINVSLTIGREDGTFGYGIVNYHASFDEFAKEANIETARIKAIPGLGYLCADLDVIHFSALPWIKFTSLSHARNLKFKDSMPKISVGKMTKDGDKLTMPISIHVHHGLVDGRDLGVFVDNLERLFK